VSERSLFHIAVVVNPYAGLGGPSGLKGSDDSHTVDIAKSLGVHSAIPAKLSLILEGLGELSDKIQFSTVSGAMGQRYFDAFPEFSTSVVFEAAEPSTGQTTTEAVNVLAGLKPDLLLFAGGDGTARDVCTGLKTEQVCLGIPSGVKMHSGVFAVTPSAVVSVVESMVNRKLVAVREGEVRDIDERSFQEGKVITKYFGSMLVPDDQLLVQTVKCSGLPDDEIALNDIAAFVEETTEDGTLYLLGSGGSLLHIKQTLGIEAPTLLGVDAWCDGEVVGCDLNEPEIYALLDEYQHVQIYLSVIGGQGIILGRGNQQISARVLEKIGTHSVQFIGTQARLHALEGQPLRVDSGDDALDHQLAGYRKILCGYDDFVLYEIRYCG